MARMMGETTPGWMTTRRDTERVTLHTVRGSNTVGNEGEWRVNMVALQLDIPPTGVRKAILVDSYSRRIS